MVDKEHTLPHSKLVLEEEGWQGGLGATPQGWQRGEQVVNWILLPFAGLGCPALVVSTTCPSAISETSYLAKGSACLKELPHFFFSLLALF